MKRHGHTVLEGAGSSSQEGVEPQGGLHNNSLTPRSGASDLVLELRLSWKAVHHLF